jgi:hypothetical protein
VSGDRDRPDMRMDLLVEGIRPLPGRHVTDHQMRLYMQFRETKTPPASAAKASISAATAYRLYREMLTEIGQAICASRFRLRIIACRMR